MDRWSDWDFKATSKDSVLLYAWSTPFQMDVIESDLAAWAKVHLAKAKEEGSSEATVTSTTLGTVGESGSAQVQLEMKTADGATLVMQGVTLPVRGQMLHLATVSSAKRASKAKSGLELTVSKLDIKTPAETLTWGGSFSADVSTTTLGDNWRKPLKSEMIAVAKTAKSLMIPKLIGCWTAIHPVAGAQPDLMVTCQDKKMVGVIDAYTFSDVEEDLRVSWFGKKGTAEAESLELGEGRMGMSFAAEIGGQELHIVGVPNEAGVAKTIVVGSGVGSLDLNQEARTVASASQVTAPAPMEFRDAALYYINYRPFHPFVIGPVVIALVILGLILSLIVIGVRRQPSYDY
jgi:hypothetical protein